MDYTCTERMHRYLDQEAYDGARALEERRLSALLEVLSGAGASSLEAYRQASEERRALELEALFQAAFSVARELCLTCGAP